MSFNITPVASGYQEIHPHSAMNIDSVKINTSLIMMKECTIHVAGAMKRYFIYEHINVSTFTFTHSVYRPSQSIPGPCDVIYFSKGMANDQYHSPFKFVVS